MLPTPKAKRSLTRALYAGLSEAGRVRSINQDSHFVGEMETGYVAVVADGMGGHKTGEVASQKAVETIRGELSQASTHPPAALAKAVQAANLEIFDYASLHPEHQGMGTTLTTVFIDDQVGLVGHVGDSRAYLIRNNGIRQLTFDHSWVSLPKTKPGGTAFATSLPMPLAPRRKSSWICFILKSKQAINFCYAVTV
jgi:PPM family protein phosphatase